MKPTRPKRLPLSITTVRRLTPDELRQASGGYVPWTLTCHCTQDDCFKTLLHC